MNGMTCTSVYAMVILEHKSIMTQLCHSILSKKAERIDSSGSYWFWAYSIFEWLQWMLSGEHISRIKMCKRMLEVPLSSFVYCIQRTHQSLQPILGITC